MQTNQKRYLVTAGLPYPNGRLHVGHVAGCYLPADIFVRFLKLTGRDVRYVCGSDDHGVAMMLAAQKEGKTPQEVADHYNKLQQEDFRSIGISFDEYGATSRNQFHAKESQKFFLEMYKRGFFTQETSKQFYDPKKEMFLPDRFVRGDCGLCGAPDQYGDQCEVCGKLLDVSTLKNAKSVFSGELAVVKESTHWFLDLSAFEDNVRRWLPEAKLRDHTRKYVEGLLSVGLVRRAMTRDIEWGVPVPLSEAKGKVLYVWFDAPIGYISNTMEMCANDPQRNGDYAQWWNSADCEIVHFIGEDNTIFHCVVWIAMLSAVGGYRLPSAVVVNQYLNIQKPGESEAQKISKSRGVGVWIGDYIHAGGDPDSLRYYLTAIAPENSKGVFKTEDLVQRHNSELGNVLGNFAQRITTFCIKNFEGAVPAIVEDKVSALDQDFLARFQKVASDVACAYEKFEAKAALEKIMQFARECNKYLDDKAPWTTRKTDLETTGITIALALRALSLLTILASPILPYTADKLAKVLNLPVDAEGRVVLRWPESARFANFASGLFESGHKLGAPQVLFPKIEESSKPGGD